MSLMRISHLDLDSAQSLQICQKTQRFKKDSEEGDHLNKRTAVNDSGSFGWSLYWK